MVDIAGKSKVCLEIRSCHHVAVNPELEQFDDNNGTNSKLSTHQRAPGILGPIIGEPDPWLLVSPINSFGR
jgi:hypothetical protein